MIVLDANLLLYAHISSFAEHEQARTWLEAQLATAARVAVPWSSALAFVRIVTNPRLFSEPESMADAWGQVDVGWTPCRSGRRARPGATGNISIAALVFPDFRPTMS